MKAILYNKLIVIILLSLSFEIRSEDCTNCMGAYNESVSTLYDNIYCEYLDEPTVNYDGDFWMNILGVYSDTNDFDFSWGSVDIFSGYYTDMIDYQNMLQVYNTAVDASTAIFCACCPSLC